MTSAYVIHDKTAYGQGIAEFFQREAEVQGMQVLGFEGTEEKANFDAILAPLIAANPDVVFFGGIYDQAAVLFKQAREKGYMGMFLSDDGFDSPEAVNIGGTILLEGGGCTTPPSPDLPSCIPEQPSSRQISRPSMALTRSHSQPRATTPWRSA